LVDFCRWTLGDRYVPGWVHHDIAVRLERFSEAVARQEAPRLILTMPPRHGKTELVGRQWLPWHMARHPGHEVIYATYGQGLSDAVSGAAMRNATKARALWPSLAPLEGGKWGVQRWECANGASFLATSSGGPAGGMGAHILALDDLIKDWEAASSATIREKVWDWYTSTAYARLAPGGGVLIMHTRWHMDDPIGRLLAAMEDGTGDEFELVNYPAIAETDEPHRRRGEALHPERYDLAELEQKRTVLGSHKWAALYQQRPSPAEGGLFQRSWLEQRYETLPRPEHEFRWAISVDCAFKDSRHADFVVMQVWARLGGRFYLVDQVRRRMDYPETRAALRTLCQAYPRATLKLVEEAANGAALIADLRASIPGIVPWRPKDSKEARAQAIAPLFESGAVYLPNKPWVGEYVEELASFPSGAHDDQVDATSQLLIRWTLEVPTIVPAGVAGVY